MRGRDNPTRAGAMISIVPTLQRVCLDRVLGYYKGPVGELRGEDMLHCSLSRSAHLHPWIAPPWPYRHDDGAQ